MSKTWSYKRAKRCPFLFNRHPPEMLEFVEKAPNHPHLDVYECPKCGFIDIRKAEEEAT